MPVWLLVLASASVAAFVSGLITLAGQYFERKSHRDELLLAKAIDLAMGRSRFLADLAQKHGNSVAIEDDVLLAEKYYQWLLHLLEHGELPSEAPALDGLSRSGSAVPKTSPQA